MAKLKDATAYFQATCFPQKFISVQVGFGASATLEPGDNAADVEARLFARSRARVEREIAEIMKGAAPEQTTQRAPVSTTRRRGR